MKWLGGPLATVAALARGLRLPVTGNPPVLGHASAGRP